jgi:hypothetical protein
MTTKIQIGPGSGAVIQDYGSKELDPDPKGIITDPQH